MSTLRSHTSTESISDQAWVNTVVQLKYIFMSSVAGYFSQDHYNQ